MGKKTFRVEDFREAIADLKAPKWRKFTDNFLPCHSLGRAVDNRIELVRRRALAHCGE